MRIDFSMGKHNTLFPNMQTVNANLAKQRGAKGVKQAEESRKDRVFISVQGKASSQTRIENLQSQKQSILERKSEIRQKALEDGKSPQEINTLLETYDMQIQQIDTQIAKIQAEDAQKATEPKQEQKDTTPKTETEQQQDQIQVLTEFSVKAEQSEVLYHTKKEIEGDARVLESEIELDKSRGVGKDTIDRKEKDLQEMRVHADTTMEKIAENNKDITDKTLSDTEEKNTPTEKDEEDFML